MDNSQIASRYAQAARKAGRELARFDAPRRSAAIAAIADALEARTPEILVENARDLEKGRQAGLTPYLLDRLALDPKRISAMASGLRQISSEPDPVGKELSRSIRPNGLDVRKVTVPLGVVLFIYESRPNVTTDAAGLCLRSGNAIILRGGKEAIHSNLVLGKIISEAIAAHGLPQDAVQLVRETDRTLVGELLQKSAEIDLVIPRGGEGLIRAVTEQSKIPVLKHYKGVCHVYIHPSADPVHAVTIAHNAKVQRPGVCNAAETLLLDKDLSLDTARRVLDRLDEAGVELRGDAATRAKHPGLPWKEATDADWDEEYLEKIISVREVNGVKGAVEHIAAHGSGHTEAIVAQDEAAIDEFILGCDSSSVIVNASTRFADGGEYGLGAEIGISTDKLHARGPMGASDLCSYKWIVRGNGQVRG